MIDQIGKFRIVSELGQGAMGVAYRGVDPALERPVAIKTIHAHLLGSSDGAELLARFKTEAMAAARCMHPNIVTVYDFGNHQGMAYIAMEFVQGRGLDEILKDGTPLPLKRINTIILGICRGLNYAHQQSIVHRDIKPANILVAEGDNAKIADFGIALLPLSDAQQFGAGIGTPSYMSPEQRDGRDVDQRADVFSLGVVIYELMSACGDFPDASRTTPVKVIPQLPKSKKLDPERKFPASIAAFLDRCLAPNADQRYSGCPQVLEGYKAALQSLTVKAAPGAAAKPGAAPAARPTAGLTGVVPAVSPSTTRTAAIDPDATRVSGASAASADDSFYKTRAVPGTDMQATHVATSNNASGSSASGAGGGGPRPVVTFLDAMRTIKSLDPVLNEDWHERLMRIMNGLDQNGWKRAIELLEPKGINWDDPRKRFVFAGQPSVRDLSRNLTTPQLAQLADRLAGTLDQLGGQLRNVVEIADALEGGLANIDRFDPNDNVNRQKEKVRLREAWLYEFATRVRKVNFEIPKSLRDLTVEEVRAFMIDVFIRHQLQGYWFQTVNLQELSRDPNPFIKGKLWHEVKTRSLTVVRTDRYYFLVGSVIRYEQNQYSIRRFLVEEVAMQGRVVYFNGIVIDRHQVTQTPVQDRAEQQVSRIITIQRQLSEQIIELVTSFGDTQDKYLRPQLFKRITADGTALDAAIETRLQEYEKNASRLVFGKIPKALQESCRNQDDFEYLFIGLRAFLIEMLADIQDFSYQSAVQWTTKGQELEYRIASYLRLLEKRKDALFTGEGAALKGDDPAYDATLPGEEVKAVIDDIEPKLDAHQALLKEIARQKSEPKSGFKKMLEGMGIGTIKADPEKLRKEIDAMRVNCFMSIVRIPKKYPKMTVYLEFEDLVPVDERARHYAFPAGKLGIALLPALLRLPENKDEFNIVNIRRAVEYDVYKAAQSYQLGV